MKAFFLLLFASSLLFSAPALSLWRTYVQSDATTFQAIPQGDEYLHFLKTKNGDILIFNPKTKNFDYAEIKNDRLAPSGIPYRPISNDRFRQNVAKTRLMPMPITTKQLEKLYKMARKRFNTR